MDAISELAGLIDVSFYETGYYPTGADVAADILQNLNKLNEVIQGLTEVAGDLDTEEESLIAEGVTRAAADAALDVRVTANEEAIAPLLAGNLATASFNQDSDVALTTNQCNLYGYINLIDDAAGHIVTLPNGMAAAIIAGGWEKHNIVITNMTEGAITVKPLDTGYWGNGLLGSWGNGVILSKGYSVTVVAGDEQDSYAADKWYITAGPAYPS